MKVSHTYPTYFGETRSRRSKGSTTINLQGDPSLSPTSFHIHMYGSCRASCAKQERDTVDNNGCREVEGSR